ncbi:Ankyrin-1 [Dactylella cylindrospora]|nr:Ankyrin-1 [Dactylella cylindrospora]
MGSSSIFSPSPTSPTTSNDFPEAVSPVVTVATSPIQAPGNALKTRLSDIAFRGGVEQFVVEPALRTPLRPTLSTADTATTVREKLISIRRARPDYKPPSNTGGSFLRRKTQKAQLKDEAQAAIFKFKELSFALEQEILQPATPESNPDLENAANIEALIDMGADPNTYKHAKDNLMSKMHLARTGSNVEVPARYIQDAAERGKANVVAVLASRGARQASLDEAYHIAMNNADAQVVQVLLEYGADPNAYPADFESIVQVGRVDIVKLVLRSSKKIAQESIDKPLKGAVEMAYIEIIEALVAYGADLDYNNGESLLLAAQAGRWDILLRMVLNNTRPDILQGCLSAAATAVISNHRDPDLRLILIEILLCAGAKGDEIAGILVLAVTENDTNLITTLLDLGVDVNYDEAKALRNAVSWCSIPLVGLLLSRPPNLENLSLAFGEIPFASQSEENIRTLAALLLSAGASGENVAKMLVQAVRAGYNDLLELLVDNNASIEYNDSEALVYAVTAVDIRKVKTLLKSHIGPRYASVAFAEIDLTLDEPTLHELMSMLLSRGAAGDPVDKALVVAVREKQWTLIGLLLSHGASPEYANAASLVQAVRDSDETMLDTLLQHPIAPDSANTAFSILGMDTNDLYPLAKRLIQAGAHGLPLSKLLISAVERQNFTIVSLLLSGGAKVAYDSGTSLKKAVETGDDSLVKMLISKCTDGVSSAVMLAAFPLANSLPDEQRTAMTALFIQYGVRGSAIAEALVKEVKKSPINYTLIEILLRKADGDLSYNDGSAVKTAVSRGDLQLLKILLDASPNNSIVSAAIPYAMDVRNDSTRYSIVEMLLAAGAEGDEISIALIKTVKKQPEALGQVSLLLNYGADVNFGDGEVLKAAFASKRLEVLKKVAKSGASQPSLSPVFQAAWGEENDDWKYRVVEITLRAGLRGPIVNDALINLAQQDSTDPKYFVLLLKYGASVNHAAGGAILHCVRRGAVEKLKLLLQSGPEKNVVRDALQVAMEHKNMATKRAMVEAILACEPDQGDIDNALIRAMQDRSPSKRLVTLLLDHEASVVYEDCKSLRLATLGSYHQCLTLLLVKYPYSTADLTMVLTTIFDEAMTAAVWTTEDGLRTMEVLLAHGACGVAIDKAFATAAESYESYPTSKRLIEALLQSPNANVNREDGRCLHIATGKANVELVELLLRGNPSKRTLSMSFPYLISSGTDEETLMIIANMFLAEGMSTDLNFQHPSFGPIFFGTLTKYPSFVGIYELLIDRGANLESEVKVKFHSVGENVTPLLWAVLQPANVIDSKVISCFIEAGANVNYKTEYSRTTPLMVAVQRKRRDIVFQLLKAGASVIAEDQKGQTALLKASQDGSYDIVELLLTMDRSRNDGSLHEAAAFCRIDVIQLLVRDGHHDPNFPSSRHDGRSALAQLALEGDPIQNQERVKQTFELLFEIGADPSLRSENKSPLIFALDNKHPIEMTRILLTAGGYENINESYNLYQDDHKTIYSPTMYAQKGLTQNKSPEVQQELYKLLRGFRGIDRYYIDDTMIPQPAGYKGIPENLRRIEEEREAVQRRIEHERQLQQTRIRLEKEEASERERVRNQEYQAELVRTADRKAREEQRAAEQRASELAYLRTMNEERQRAQDVERNRQLSHTERMHREEQQHRTTMTQQEMKMIDYKAASDRKRQQEIEDASNREHNRQMTYLRQIKGNIEAAQRVPLSPGQKQLMWPYTNNDVPD